MHVLFCHQLRLVLTPNKQSITLKPTSSEQPLSLGSRTIVMITAFDVQFSKNLKENKTEFLITLPLVNTWWWYRYSAVYLWKSSQKLTYQQTSHPPPRLKPFTLIIKTKFALKSRKDAQFISKIYLTRNKTASNSKSNGVGVASSPASVFDFYFFLSSVLLKKINFPNLF